MADPVLPASVVLGREAEIERAAQGLLAGPGARVLVHGPPGVGKDTVAARVACDPRVQELGGTDTTENSARQFRNQAWFVGTTDATFAPALVAYFTTRLPDVAKGCKPAQALVKIKVHLFCAPRAACYVWVWNEGCEWTKGRPQNGGCT